MNSNKKFYPPSIMSEVRRLIKTLRVIFKNKTPDIAVGGFVFRDGCWLGKQGYQFSAWSDGPHHWNPDFVGAFSCNLPYSRFKLTPNNVHRSHIPCTVLRSISYT
jgi:phosphatidylserine decarboxylase